MHIVFFTVNMKKGGTERVISSLCNEYLIKKYRVSVVTLHSAVCCYELDAKIRIYSLGMRSECTALGKVLDLRKAAKMYVKVMLKIKPDIILAFLPRPALIACAMKKKLGIPVIGSIRSDPKVNFSNVFYRLTARKILARADGFVFQTKEAQKFFPKALQKKSALILNPVSQGAVREPYKGERSKRIVSVGRFSEEKNYPLLIRAFAKLDPEYQDYSLWIYGRYDERLHIKELAESLGVKDRVVFAGETDAVYDAIYDAALFVLPSRSEGMPNAMMEAMAMGLPVVAADCPCGGVRMLVQNGVNGVLVPNEDERALVQAMNRVLADSGFASKIGEKAAEIKKRCSGEKIYREWDNYITNVRRSI